MSCGPSLILPHILLPYHTLLVLQLRVLFIVLSPLTSLPPSSPSLLPTFSLHPSPFHLTFTPLPSLPPPLPPTSLSSPPSLLSIIVIIQITRAQYYLTFSSPIIPFWCCYCGSSSLSYLHSPPSPPLHHPLLPLPPPHLLTSPLSFPSHLHPPSLPPSSPPSHFTPSPPSLLSIIVIIQITRAHTYIATLHENSYNIVIIMNTIDLNIHTQLYQVLITAHSH